MEGGDAEAPPNDVALTGPSVVITDSEPNVTATGNVTFTFEFSKNVGTSFTADDVAVTGGTKGAFAMAGGGRSATLVVVPTPNSTGTMTVIVAAGTFEDANGTKNTLAASATQAYSTLPGGGGGGSGDTVLITWDETTSPVSNMGAYGDGSPSVEAAPAGVDVSGNALKIARSGAQTFGGTFFTITPAIAFTADRKTITARVYSSRAGAVIKLKVEATDGSSVEVAATQAVTAANTWQTLSWNLSGVDPAKSYTVIAISPDVDVPLGGAQSYWIENITLTTTSSGGGGGAPTGTVLITWDETTSPVSNMGAYGDGAPSVEAAPAGADVSGNALKIARSGAQTFGGTFFTITPAIAFTADRKTITARVYSSRAGAVIKLKVEATDGSSVEVAATQAVTAANTWQTLTWNLSGVDPAKSYTVIAISPDVDVTLGGAQSYWIENVTLAAASSGGGGVPPTGTVLITWDETTSPVSNMGAYGDGAPSVEAAPAGTDVSGKALKIARSGAQNFGGTFFTITPAIAFTADRKTITARVYSSRAGAVIRFKAEATDGSSVEVAATQAVTAANTWQTLSWNLSGVDLSKSYTIIAISPDVDVTLGGAQSYWIENVTLAAASSGGGGTGGSSASLVTWDESTSPVTAMGAYGDGAPSVEAAPSGLSGKALKIGRSGAQTFGGTFFTITPPIPFGANQKTITARVYSSRAGAVIRFKAEATDGSSFEVAATQPVATANTWQTLSWSLSGVDPAKSYTIMAISPDVDVAIGGAQTYWVDDITLAAASGGGGSGTLRYSSGFADGLRTIEGGTFGGFAGSSFDGYFCPGTDPASCGGGGSYAPGVAAADSNFFFYIQTPSPAVGLYAGVFVMAPGVTAPLSATADTPGVQITSQTSMTFTFGQNPEWFASTTKNFMVNLDLGKLYRVGGNACHLQLRKVITPTASAATSYTVALSSFSVVQDCGTGIAPNAVATALAASPISQISFQAAGGASAVPQGGLTTGANLSVPTGSPVVYPTTVVVKGAISFQ